MTRKAALFFALVFLILSLSSCADSSHPSCRSILDSMTETKAQLPAGQLYCFDAKEGEKEYLSPTLLSAWLGSSSASVGWLDCALYLSLREQPYELAIVLCQSSDVAEDTAKLFSARWHTVSAETAASKNDPFPVNASVTRIGNYVIFILAEDSDTLLAVAKDAIRH